VTDLLNASCPVAAPRLNTGAQVSHGDFITFVRCMKTACATGRRKVEYGRR